MHSSILGWDIGGAHIKAVVLEANGVISQVVQKPCPLWKGLDYLHKAVNQVLADIAEKQVLHAITMTGELVDYFDSRDQGVENILTTMQTCLPVCEMMIYAGQDGLLKLQQINKQHYKNIASANWLASASLVASILNNGLFIDIGSTTTDILLLSNHKVQAIGVTDYERLVSDELVYTGVIRTDVMAVAQTASFQGQSMGLMAEHFATMADVYRVTGELNEYHDQTDTADGAEKTVIASGKRLSRMTGYEFAENDLSYWLQFAEDIKQQQKNRIIQACEKQLSRKLASNKDFFIGAGVGRFLVKQIASEWGYPYRDFSDLIASKCNATEMTVADCAPAASVALLAMSIK
ncbi:MAG: H4MPT-linked C1 transfer pathway protein [Methylococcales symbiont of Hymedesmia sp. n. MRB-2018]|nr:MAG: H4MPT-linked C1 transfer pathway protein [Methylococcales symbiont of Hymedesmia sp. n. MRB-2018]